MPHAYSSHNGAQRLFRTFSQLGQAPASMASTHLCQGNACGGPTGTTTTSATIAGLLEVSAPPWHPSQHSDAHLADRPLRPSCPGTCFPAIFLFVCPGDGNPPLQRVVASMAAASVLFWAGACAEGGSHRGPRVRLTRSLPPCQQVSGYATPPNLLGRFIEHGLSDRESPFVTLPMWVCPA